MSKFIDMTGWKIGKLEIIERAKNGKRGRVMWKCRCECGNECVVSATNLRSGKTKSCGCLWYEAIKKSNSTHGEYHTRLRSIGTGIKNRCYNKNEPAYKYYGGKGVQMCPEWFDDFLNFKKWAIENGYKEDLTIDRIDVNGNYSPENCRWVAMKKQCNNRTNNVMVEMDGETKTLSEWAELSPLSYKQIWNRYHRLKWDIQDALYTPICGGKHNV